MSPGRNGPAAVDDLYGDETEIIEEEWLTDPEWKDWWKKTVGLHPE